MQPVTVSALAISLGFTSAIGFWLSQEELPVVQKDSIPRTPAVAGYLPPRQNNPTPPSAPSSPAPRLTKQTPKAEASKVDSSPRSAPHRSYPTRPVATPVQAPRLRAYRPPQSPASYEDQPRAEPVPSITLDLSLDAALPAVAAAPDPQDTTDKSPRARAAETLMHDFVSAVTTPAPAPQETAPQGAGEPWKQAVAAADERFRTLFGKEAYLRQSMQAARALQTITPD